MWEDIPKEFELKFSEKVRKGWIRLSKSIAEQYFIYPNDIISVSTSLTEYTGRTVYSDTLDESEVEVSKSLYSIGFREGNVCKIRHYQGEVSLLEKSRVFLATKRASPTNTRINIFELLGSDVFISNNLLFKLNDEYLYIGNKRGSSVVVLTDELTQIELTSVEVSSSLGIIVNASNSMNNVDVTFDESTLKLISTEFSDFPIPVSIGRMVPRVSFAYVFILLLLKKVAKTLIDSFSFFVFRGNQGYLFSISKDKSPVAVTHGINNLNNLWGPLLDFIVSFNTGSGPNQVGNSLLKYYDFMKKMSTNLPDTILLFTDGSTIAGVHPIDVISTKFEKDKLPAVITILIDPTDSDVIDLYKELADRTSGALFVYDGDLNRLLDEVIDYFEYYFPKVILKAVE